MEQIPEPTSPDLVHLLSGDLDQLVPDEYQAYRPLILHALLFFVGRLSDRRREEILDQSRLLGSDSALIDRVFLLVRLCPTLHKLGQVVSRDRRLSLALRRRLQELEVLPPSMTGAEVVALVEKELGDLPASIEPAISPLAEASVAIVLPFRWRPDGERQSVEGVFKALKPNIQARLAEELAIWSELGDFLELESRRLELPTPDYRDAVERVRELLQLEVQLDREQHNLTRAQAGLRAIPGVSSPGVLPFCSPRVTAMTRLSGSKITEPENRQHGRRLAERLVSTLIARPLLLPRGAALFHADPHAGNLLANRQGELGILDWALVGEIDKRQRIQITQILIGAMTLDSRRIHQAVRRLATTPVETAAVDLAIGRAFRELRRGRPPGLDWLFDLLDELAFGGQVRFPGDLILFRKSLLTLRGVIEEISPGFLLDLVLIRMVLSQALRDLPRRWLRNPFDRDFGTHLSNADLISLMASGPGTVRRFLGQSLRSRAAASRRSRT